MLLLQESHIQFKSHGLVGTTEATMVFKRTGRQDVRDERER